MRGKERQHRGGPSIKRPLTAVAAVLIALAALWQTNQASSQNAGWTTLFDGQHLDHWDQIGDANWVLVDGEVRGSWRRAHDVVTVETWGVLTRAQRDAVEVEAAALPLPGLERDIRVVWDA